MHKDILIEILQKLVDIWEPASGFIALIESGDMSTTTMDMLGQMMGEAISETKDESLKAVFTQAQKKIKDIQRQEAEERAEEEEDLEAMLEGLEDE